MFKDPKKYKYYYFRNIITKRYCNNYKRVAQNLYYYFVLLLTFGIVLCSLMHFRRDLSQFNRKNSLKNIVYSYNRQIGELIRDSELNLGNIPYKKDISKINNVKSENKQLGNVTYIDDDLPVINSDNKWNVTYMISTSRSNENKQTNVTYRNDLSTINTDLEQKDAPYRNDSTSINSKNVTHEHDASAINSEDEIEYVAYRKRSLRKGLRH